MRSRNREIYYFQYIILQTLLGFISGETKSDYFILLQKLFGHERILVIFVVSVTTINYLNRNKFCLIFYNLFIRQSLVQPEPTYRYYMYICIVKIQLLDSSKLRYNLGHRNRPYFLKFYSYPTFSLDDYFVRSLNIMKSVI